MRSTLIHLDKNHLIHWAYPPTEEKATGKMNFSPQIGTANILPHTFSSAAFGIQTVIPFHSFKVFLQGWDFQLLLSLAGLVLQLIHCRLWNFLASKITWSKYIYFQISISLEIPGEYRWVVILKLFQRWKYTIEIQLLSL